MTHASPPRVERGSVTMVGLGIAMLSLAVGGVSIDLWRVIEDRHELAQDADAAATAAANAVDFVEYRRSGTLAVDPSAARDIARSMLDPVVGDYRVEEFRVSADDPDGIVDDVTVRLAKDLDFVLLDLFSGGGTVTITVESTASPRLNR